MRRLLIRGVLLAAPFVVLGLFVLVVDPYDYFGTSRLVSDEVKETTAGELHYALWKIQRFEKSPVSRIILGDSSMAALNTDEIRALSNEQYFNFAYGGGTLREAIDTYWFAASRVHLDAVYIGIGLINFNEYQNLDRVTDAQSILSSPWLYLTNRVVLHAAFLATYVATTGTPANLEMPAMSREAFWRFQLDESLPELLHRYRYPTAVAAELQRIAEHCRRHGTRLVIVIPPTAIELQQKIVALGRSADETRFKQFVRTLAPVYDFDVANEFTASRANFSDPFHTVNEREIIQEVWGERPRYSQLSYPTERR